MYLINKWKIFPVLSVVVFMLIIIPKVQAQKYIMTYLYGAGNYIEMMEERENNFNEVSPSYFDINEDGTLKLNYIDRNFVNEMRNRGIKIVPFLSNHWDRELGRKAVQNYDDLASQIAEAVRKYELDGVNVDIENLTEVDRENYTNLVKTLREKLSKDKIVAVSVAANPNGINIGWQGSYDYKELAQYADYMMIMAYDEHYEGGVAGPVASIDFVEKSIQYATKYVEKEKIVLGIPLYGRVWDVNTGTGGIGVSLKQVDKILNEYDSEIIFDRKIKSPKATVTIKNTDSLPKIGGKILGAGKYEIWYEDAESISAKLDLIQKYDLKGVGMWKTGLETTSVWATIINGMGEIYDKIKGVFNDVKSTHWAYEHISFVNEKGFMIGKGENKFKPEDPLTRAEIATIISRIVEDKNIEIKQEIGGIDGFLDVSNHWAENEIIKLRHLNIIKGYENNEFKPDNEVTRAEACAIITRVLEYINRVEWGSNSRKYLDLDSKHWAYSEIVKLSGVGIINGYDNGNFGPELPIKRAEFAKIIQKIYEKTV